MREASLTKKDRIEALLTKSRSLWETVRWGTRDRLRHYLARANRERLNDVTFVGITGSSGKTTTKDMVVALLSTQGKVRSVLLSGNDHEMIDRLVLGVSHRDRFCVAEIGAIAPNYIDRSLRTVRPKIGVLTVVQREHFASFRSVEAIAAEKRKLIDCLPTNGTAILNIDDPLVRSIGEEHKGTVIWVGDSEGATLRLLEASSAWPDPLSLRVAFAEKEYVIHTRLHGKHLSLSVLSALGVGVAVGMSLDEAVAAIQTVEPTEGRMQVLDDGRGVTFVRDDFKCPEWSLDAPLDFMKEARAARKIIVLGTISHSALPDRKRYSEAVRRALEVADMVILAGSHTLSASRARGIRDDGTLHTFRSVRDVSQLLDRELRAGDLVLLKGTNKQDHLVRLFLDRQQPVQCWRMTCGREGFCGTGCSLAYQDRDGAAVERSDEASHDAWSDQIPIVVGIGNPGEKYVNTPHNVAHRLLDAIVADAGGTWQRQPEGLVATVPIDGIQLSLFKPESNVNRSGDALRRLLARLHARPRNCVIVLDDADLLLGDARLKRAGGDAGHRGMRSIVAELGTDEITRVRIGIRGVGDERKAKGLVLESFSPGDRPLVEKGLQRARQLLCDSVRMSNGGT